MKFLIKQVVSNISFPFFRIAEDCFAGRELRVLVYHSIAEELDIDTMGLRVTPERFRAHMKHLRQWGYQVLDIKDIFNKADIAKKSVVLTFDDGYKDFLTSALPILEDFGYPATVFVTVEYLKGNASRQGTGYWENWDKMSWKELKTAASSDRITVGSHSLKHRRLTQLSQQELKEEVARSKEILEDELGIPVDFFAYPYGFYNQVCQNVAMGAGYKAAFTGRIGAVNIAFPYSLNRTEISRYDSEFLEFRKKINGSYDWLRYKYIFGRR